MFCPQPNAGRSCVHRLPSAPGCGRSGAKWYPGRIGGMDGDHLDRSAHGVAATGSSGPDSLDCTCLFMREGGRTENAGFICNLDSHDDALRAVPSARCAAPSRLSTRDSVAASCDHQREVGWGYIGKFETRGSRPRRSSFASEREVGHRRSRPAATKRGI